MVDEALFRKLFDSESHLSPHSRTFDRVAFRREFGIGGQNNIAPDLPTNPEPGEYRVLEDGFVTIMMTVYGDEAVGHLYATTHIDDSYPIAFGGVSVQNDEKRGIKNFENSATVPVRAGEIFTLIGSGTQEKVRIRAAFVPFGRRPGT